MSYETLTNSEVKRESMLCVLKPRKVISTWTLVSGSVYSAPFDFTQYVKSLEVNGVALSQGSSSSLSSGQFYFDITTKTIYARLSDDSDPNLKFLVCIFELYLADIDVNWHRDPLDDTSLEVYFEPYIEQTPQLKASNTDLLQGYLPTQTSQITLSNSEHWLEKYLHDSSFNQCEITVYHWLSEPQFLTIEVENIKKIENGVCGKVSYNDDSVTIEILDRVDLLDVEWRNLIASFYSTDLFPNMDANFVGRPIRYVFGRVEGFKPVNVNQVNDAPTTSDNRSYCVMGENTGIGEISKTVAASPASTTTRTYIPVQGINVGDTVWLDGASDYYVKVEAVGANYIEHAAIGAPMSAGEFVKRGFVSSLTIIQSGIAYQAFYKRDYTCTDDILSSNLAGIILDASFESNIGLPENVQGYDVLYCTVYGRTNYVTMGMSSFGSNDSRLGNLANPAVIMWDILKSKTQVQESDLDSISFTAFEAAFANKPIGIAIPSTSSQDFPSVKKLCIDIMQTVLGRLYLNTDIEWAVSLVSLLGSPDFTVGSDEILKDSFKASFSYSDVLSDVFVTYNEREISETGREAVSTVTTHSDLAEFLHKKKAQKTFSSLFVFESEAQALSDSLSLIFGDREAEYSLDTKGRLFPTTIGQVVEVSRTRLPGYSYDSEIERTRKFSVLGVQKGLKRVSLTLSDQRGLEGE